MYIQGGLLNFIVLLAGVLLLSNNVSGLRGSALVAELKAKAKAALLAPTEMAEEIVTVENNSTGNATNVTMVKTKSLLTGNPQKDYILDPNLPRELNGYNLTDYPFYNAVPEDIDFKCDGLHDGFYASVPHKCQLYHHCLFGTRYDFLCANYTAFDQKTFICHFVSEVDCDNSPKHYDRNEALYKSASTAAPITTTTTTQRPTTTTTQAPTARPRRRRPYRRRRPVYDYYYDDQYDDEEYYDDEDIPPPPRRKMNRKHRPQHGPYRDEESMDVDPPETRDTVKPNIRPNGPTVASVYARPRAPPKVRRPVPINERDKYDYKPPEDSSSSMKESQKIPRSQQKKQRVEDDEYYDDDDYEEEPPVSTKKIKPVDYHGDLSSKGESHRPSSRFRQRQQNHRKRDRYEDEYDEDDRPARPSRKQMRHEEYSRPNRPNRDRTGHKTHLEEDLEEAVPAERPGYISKDRLPHGSRKQIESESSRSRFNQKSRPVHEEDEDEEYYDEGEEEEEDMKVSSRKNLRNGNNKSKEHSDYDYAEETKGRTTNSDRSRGQIDVKSLGSQRSSNRNKGRASSRVSIRTEDDRETVPVKSGSSSSRIVQKNNNKFSRPSIEVEDDEDEDDYEEEEYDEKPQQTPTRNNERFKENTKQSMGQTRGSGSSSVSEEPAHKAGFTPSTSLSNQNQGFLRSNFRSKITTGETITSTSTIRPTSGQYEDYDDNKSTFRPQSSSYVESKSRVNQSTYDRGLENTKGKRVKQNIEHDDYTEGTSRPVSQSSKLDDSYDTTPAPLSVPPRPSIGLFRRPTKPTKSDITSDSPISNFRRSSADANDDEKPQQRNGPTSSGQFLRRVKIENIKNENLPELQQKFSNTGGYFRRLEKPVDSTATDYLNNPQSQVASQQLTATNNTNKYTENQPTRIGVKRVKLVEVQLRGTSRPSDNYKENEPTSTTESVKNFNRPLATSRPAEDTKQKDESTKIPVTSSSAVFRRPLKQRLKEVTIVDSLIDSGSSKQTPPSGLGGNYQRPESEAIATFSSNKGHLNHNRGKTGFEEDSSISRLVEDSNVELISRNPPNIDITAPGPSGAGIDSVPIRSDYRDSHTPSGFTLDIPDEEYDVTLNDALQPSTLHPTRSLVDYQQNRFKTRGFQPTLPQPSGFANRGTASFLTPAASQQYISQVQSTISQDRDNQPSGSDTYIDKHTSKGRQQTSDSQRYEDLVLTGPANQQWISQRNPRLTEWFW